MKSSRILSRVRQITSPPIFANDARKRREATITYLVIILAGTAIILAFSAFFLQSITTVVGLTIEVLVLLVAIFLAYRGGYFLASLFVPISLFAVITCVAYFGQGIHDIALFGFPMIIILAGLMQGRSGALTAALAGSLGVAFVYLAEISGQLPNLLLPARITTLDDLLIVLLLLWITAAFTNFTTGSLVRSLEMTRASELAVRRSGESTGEYARVLELRTRQLLTGAEVSRAASSILDPDPLSQQVVEMVWQRFSLYYVGLFLVENQEWAVLHAGTGEAGRQMLANRHRLKIGNTSMIGWCIAHQKARIALDVGTEAVRFDNPLLPDTRSELALPLISRGEVLGALSIQSRQEAAFSEEDIVSFQTMGDQLANAIRNAQLYDELDRELAQRRRAEKEVRKLNKDLEKRVQARTQELQEANNRLMLLGRLKDEFLSNVSHELRTPITSIMLYHSLIEEKPEQARQYMDNLKRETRRLDRLIEDLLFLSRLDQGRIQLNPTHIDLNRLVKDYSADRQPLVLARHLTLEVETEAALPPVLADEQMLGQVLSILLTNAVNYTQPTGRIIIRTQSETHGQKTWVGFAVCDTGAGVAPEERERLFERFFRGKAGHESTVPGTGLGLSIAREIIDKHQGRIEVLSEGTGKGATFRVWVPVDPIDVDLSSTAPD